MIAALTGALSVILFKNKLTETSQQNILTSLFMLISAAVTVTTYYHPNPLGVSYLLLLMVGASVCIISRVNLAIFTFWTLACVSFTLMEATFSASVAALTLTTVALSWIIHTKWAPSKERQNYEENKVASFEDPLTGLYNRRGLEQAGTDLISATKIKDMPISVAFLDVDGLKKVNDTYGHEAGDALLVGVSEALKNSLRQSDVVARWGGDEFVIVSSGWLHPGLLTQRMITYLEENEPISASWWKPSITIGHASAMASEQPVLSELLVKADNDMYNKRKNRAMTNELIKFGVEHREGLIEDPLETFPRINVK